MLRKILQEKGIVATQLVVLVILIAGLAVGSYFVQQNQDLFFKPQAAPCSTNTRMLNRIMLDANFNGLFDDDNSNWVQGNIASSCGGYITIGNMRIFQQGSRSATGASCGTDCTSWHYHNVCSDGVFTSLNGPGVAWRPLVGSGASKRFTGEIWVTGFPAGYRIVALGGPDASRCTFDPTSGRAVNCDFCRDREINFLLQPPPPTPTPTRIPTPTPTTIPTPTPTRIPTPTPTTIPTPTPTTIPTPTPSIGGTCVCGYIPESSGLNTCGEDGDGIDEDLCGLVIEDRCEPNYQPQCGCEYYSPCSCECIGQTHTPIPPFKPSTGCPCSPGDDVFCSRYPEIETALGCIPTHPLAFVSRFYNILLRLGVGIAFIFMIIGSFFMLTSRGNPEQVQRGKEIFVGAVIGLVFMIFATFILELIGVDVLGLL